MLATSVLAPLTAALGSVADAAKKGSKGKRKKGAGKKPRAPKGSPNFVVIVTDDMRASDWQALPKTKALLAPRGTWFPNFLTVNPVCSPSRASILTGMHSHNNGVRQNKGRWGGFDAFTRNKLEQQTIAFRLSRKGYRTALIGKFLNGYSGKGKPPKGWDRWVATSTLSYLNFTLNEDGKQKKYTGQKNYLTDVLRGKAVDFIGSTPRDTPLFLYLPLKAPHSPATPAKRDRNAYRGVAVERTPSLNEEDVSDKPAYIRNAPKIDLGLLDRDEQRRLASLRSADAAINAVIQKLRTEGRLDNTYIFVFSDNGWMRGEHRMLTKGFPYDSSVRIPMVVSGPGIAAGETDHRIVANVDVAPTIAALAKIPLPRADGKNLLSDLDREYMLMESWGGPTWSALRGKTWLYVENDSDEREYYDYETDEYELENQLANWGGHTPALDDETAARLEARLSEAKRCKGAQCP